MYFEVDVTLYYSIYGLCVQTVYRQLQFVCDTFHYITQYMISLVSTKKS